jgi:flagellin FlaB
MGCKMRRMCYSLFKNRFASIGIGAMVVFIAMVLVAGISASVLVQTSAELEIQSMSTGSETTTEVSTGLSVFNVLGNATTGQDIDKLAIGIRPRAGSGEIDIGEIYVELSDKNKKNILTYNSSFFLEPSGQDDIFGASVFPDDEFGYGNHWSSDGSEFGVLVIEDYDDSISSSTVVVMNRGDKVYLCLNTTAIYNNIAERTDIWGLVIPEYGGPGVIEFQTPSTYSDNVMELQ